MGCTQKSGLQPLIFLTEFPRVPYSFWVQITIHSKGANLGPFPPEQVKHLLRSGEVSPSDLGWSPGMTEWKPLSTFGDLQESGTLPPLPSKAPAHEKGLRTEPLAIWSLVLGILSLLVCSLGGFLIGIPAVICGHIGRSRIRKSSNLRGAGLALAGLITGYLAIASLPIFAGLAVPAVVGAIEKGQATQILNHMRQIHIAVQSAQIDGTATNNPKLGFPASANLQSKAELRAMLISNGYITEEALDNLNFDEMTVGNVSDEDPADTVFLKATTPGGKYVIFMQVDGAGSVFSSRKDVFTRDPPRTPAFLAP